MFRRLRIKLTVLYAGLFALILALVAVAVYGAVTANARKVVRDELSATGEVFDRLWALRTQRLHEGADLLARDFGFREAVATRDAPTIQSALTNLRARMGLDLAFILDVDGGVIGLDPALLPGGPDRLWRALDANPESSGVFVVGDQTYQAISAPVLAPTLTGWVVFATRLDQKEMNALAQLAAIPLQASVLDRREGRWNASSSIGQADRARITEFVERGLSRPDAGPGEVRTRQGEALALVRALGAFDGDAPAALLLRYPTALALAPYRPLLAAILALGVLGLVMVAVGSWFLSRGVTQPLSVLEEAAERLRDGGDVVVPVQTRDEIGRLAESFNSMAAEIRSRELKITHMALHDAETLLPNRRSLEQALQIDAGGGAAPMLVVAAVGLDRFHLVRGAIGYGLAADLVAQVGARLQALSPHGAVARLATSTLAVSFRAASLDEAQDTAAAMLSALEQPARLGEDRVDVTVSIGLAAAPHHAERPDRLVERSLIALDQARAARTKTALFDEAAYGDPAGNLSLISDMMEGLQAGQIALHYQPKYDYRAQRITGVEALLRWTHPTRGPLAPDMFVAMAEDTGHIGPLTDWVLRRALRDQEVLRQAGHDLTMSVNLSGRVLGDAAFAARTIAAAGHAPGRLCFEITETAIIDNPQEAMTNLAAFAEAGIAISIDDYGAGLSSLAYLKRIKADELKIDKDFVLSLAQNGRDALLVKSTIDLGHALGMKVVAEGVEDGQALALLGGMGCDIAQGYHIARPMPLEGVIAFLDRTPCAPALPVAG